jgi:hypothetical protein
MIRPSYPVAHFSLTRPVAASLLVCATWLGSIHPASAQNYQEQPYPQTPTYQQDPQYQQNSQYPQTPSYQPTQQPVDCQNYQNYQNQGYQTSVPPGCNKPSKGAMLAAMLVEVLSRQLVNVVSTQSFGLLDNWIGWLFGKAKISPANAAPVQPSLTAAAANNGQMLPPPTVPVSTQQQQEAVQQAVGSPMLAIAATFLSGPEANAPQHPQHGSVEIKSREGQPLSFNVYNHDVFALHFTPSTPGMVRLTSKDNSKEEDLDLYTVMPGEVNRLPRQGQGGIVVDTNIGTETLRITFEPCLPDALINQATVQPFVGRLQKCTLQNFVKSGNSKSAGKAMARGLALTVPASNGIGMIGTNKDYVAGTYIVHEIQINHLTFRP